MFRCAGFDVPIRRAGPCSLGTPGGASPCHGRAVFQPLPGPAGVISEVDYGD